MANKVVRERAYWKPEGETEAQLVTVLEKGRRKSRIRTAFGFMVDDVPNKALEDIEEPEDGNEPSEASFTFEKPGASAA